MAEVLMVGAGRKSLKTLALYGFQHPRWRIRGFGRNPEGEKRWIRYTVVLKKFT
ncbi:hypothetical protein Bca4012_066055 [Brassica carinata]